MMRRARLLIFIAVYGLRLQEGSALWPPSARGKITRTVSLSSGSLSSGSDGNVILTDVSESVSVDNAGPFLSSFVALDLAISPSLFLSAAAHLLPLSLSLSLSLSLPPPPPCYPLYLLICTQMDVAPS